MKKIICDRCGGEATAGKCHHELQFRRTEENVVGRFATYMGGFSGDLCQSCVSEIAPAFVAFLTGMNIGPHPVGEKP